MIDLLNLTAGFAPGVEVDGSLRVPSLGLVLKARNVSLLGVQTISRCPFIAGTQQNLEFRLRHRDTLFLWARATYCLPLRDADGPSFGTGWAWAEDRATTENAAALVNYLTEVCTLPEFSGISRHPDVNEPEAVGLTLSQL